jgi:hypothetical protein
MTGMGPEAALLSARLAEIHALRDHGRAVREGDRSIYVEAAMSGRRDAPGRGWGALLLGRTARAKGRDVGPVALPAMPALVGVGRIDRPRRSGTAGPAPKQCAR